MVSKVQPGREALARMGIYRTVSDGLGRVVSEWVGTDDTPTTGFWSPSNLTGTDMVKVREYEYDGGGVGDSNLTKVTDIPGLSVANRVAQTYYDWRDRAVAVKAGVQGTEATDVNRPITYTDYDNLDEVTKARLYDGDGVSITTTSGEPCAPGSLTQPSPARSGCRTGRTGPGPSCDSCSVPTSTGWPGPPMTGARLTCST